MVKTFGAPRECGALGQLPLLHPPSQWPWPLAHPRREKERRGNKNFSMTCLAH